MDVVQCDIKYHENLEHISSKSEYNIREFVKAINFLESVCRNHGKQDKERNPLFDLFGSVPLIITSPWLSKR
jgi:hypothetical protein